MGRWLFVWGPPVALMTALALSSSVPDLDTEQTGFSDKTVHFWAYATLGALMLRALADASWRAVAAGRALRAWALTVAWGALDEMHQAFVPGRFSSWADWLADVLGAGAAVIVVFVLARGLGKRRAV